MASGQIRMTPDTMRERAGEYRTEAENVQNVIDKMADISCNPLTEWEGSASEAYVNKFAELRPSFVKGKELIDDIAMALDKTCRGSRVNRYTDSKSVQHVKFIQCRIPHHRLWCGIVFVFGLVLL